MVIVKLEEKWMSIGTTRDEDVGEITGEGSYVKQKTAYVDEERDILNIPVKITTQDSKALIWSPWDKDKKKFMEAFGAETANWVGKKFKIMHIDKKMIVRPIVE